MRKIYFLFDKISKDVFISFVAENDDSAIRNVVNMIVNAINNKNITFLRVLKDCEIYGYLSDDNINYKKQKVAVDVLELINKNREFLNNYENK